MLAYITSIFPVSLLLLYLVDKLFLICFLCMCKPFNDDSWATGWASG